MAISFNFKKKSNVEEVVEKYNFPVLTSCIIPAIKGSVARFEMNKALIEALNIDFNKDPLVSIGQNDDGDLVLVNTTGMSTPYQYHVNKDGSINSKKLHDRLMKSNMNFNPAVVNEFMLLGSIEDELNIATIIDTVVISSEVTESIEATTVPIEVDMELEDSNVEFFDPSYVMNKNF